VFLVEERFYTAAEVASMLRVARTTIYAWVEQDLVPHQRIGPHGVGVRFTAEDVRSIVRSRQARPVSA